MRMSLALGGGAALALLAACLPPSKPQLMTGADSTALTKVRTDFAAAWNKGDVNAVIALHTGDATLLPGDHAAVIGTTSLRAYYDTTLGTPTRPKIDVPQGFFTGRQDMAVASGSFTLTPPAPPAPARGAAPPAPPPLAGKYLIVLMRQTDGNWKIRYDAVSLDAPMPAAPEVAPKRGRR